MAWLGSSHHLTHLICWHRWHLISWHLTSSRHHLTASHHLTTRRGISCRGISSHSISTSRDNTTPHAVASHLTASSRAGTPSHLTCCLGSRHHLTASSRAATPSHPSHLLSLLVASQLLSSIVCIFMVLVSHCCRLSLLLTTMLTSQPTLTALLFTARYICCHDANRHYSTCCRTPASPWCAAVVATV